ncbi:hypothetical protein BTR23_07860 [Alkalihalophilus pseudofirmus]|nr:hypothetical protein BTR23_07860 [Alkalihalophilus pseudofirmus]
MGTISVVIGGVGLFLLGMTLMTDGLKALAGDALKQLLSKFTGGTFSSVLSGATITALIQSSSATTFMTIGFVSAGLLTFTQSVGVIIGANVGSTSTGWLVSVIGFKVNMATLALPLVGVGVFLKLFSKGKLAPHGMALAGFGLLFLGIDILQQGMSGIGDMFDLGALSGDTFLHLVLLIVIGIAMTVIMQSSSAAVVTTLTALYAGAITFDQAAVLVIGQNVGTTVKAIIAAIGSSTPAKRTAVAHILFNILTGLVALISLHLLISVVFYISDLLHITDKSVSLAIFHTLFNIIGVLLIVPFMPLFIKLVIRMVPEKGDHLTKHLDHSVATVGPVAIEAVRRTLFKILSLIAVSFVSVIKGQKPLAYLKKSLDDVENALIEIRGFLSKIHSESPSNSDREYNQHVSMIHAVDHIHRLTRALKETESLEKLKSDIRITNLLMKLSNVFEQVSECIEKDQLIKLVDEVEQNSIEIASIRKEDRKTIIKTTAKSQLNVNEAIEKVHSIHWIDRVAYHLWRTVYHLDEKETLEITDYDLENGPE